MRRDTSTISDVLKDREGDDNVLLSQTSERRREIRPGVERMPCASDRFAIVLRELRQVMSLNHRVEHVAMYIIDVERRGGLPHHGLERAPAILVGDRRPVGVYPPSDSRVGEGLTQASMPVEDGASDVECQRLDLRHHAGGWGLPSLGGWERSNPGICRTVTISRSGGNDDGLPFRARLAEIDHPSYWVRQRNIGKTLAFFWPDLSEIPRWKRHRHPPRPRSRWQTHVGPAVETLVFRHRIHFVCAM